MRTSPKVSVILPSLNVASYIRECVDSVINQTLKEIEIICVDAGSTDGTVEILREYESRDSRVKVIHSDKRSYGYQINKGFDYATGKYVGIVETDDYVLSEMFEVLLDIAENNQVDFIRSDFTRFWGEGNDRNYQAVPLTYWVKRYEKYYNKVINPADDLAVFNLLKNNVTGIYNLEFIRKNNIRLNETPGASFQDNGLWFLTFIYAKRAYFLNRAFYMCRRDNPNSSINDKGKAFIVCNEYTYIFDHLKEKPELYKKFIPAYWVGKFGSYNFTYSRVSEYLKYPFLKQFVDEFLEGEERGELRKELFPIHHWSLLQKMMENPVEYYIEDFKTRTKDNFEQHETARVELLDGIQQEAISSEKQFKIGHDIKVSVIVPVYNLEEYLKQCVDSILSQTLREIEVLCVDDGSSDASLAILHAYQTEDPRIRVLCQANAGAGAARNYAMSEAKGQFIAFVDGDDWYPENDTLEKLYTMARKHNVRICGGSVTSWCNDHYITTFGENLAGNTFKKNALINYTEYQFDYSYQRFIYERTLLEENNIIFPLYRRFQDPPFFVKAMLAAESFYAISDITYCYRYIPKQLTLDMVKVQDLMLGLIHVLELSKEHKLANLHRLTLYRCENDFYKTLIAIPEFKNEQTLSYLILLNQTVDRALLGLDEHYVVKPLHDIAMHTTRPKAAVPQTAATQVLGCREKYLEQELFNVQNSWSFRIGRLITYIPRKIRGGIRCYQEHGWSYTWQRVLVHLRMKEDPYK